MRREQFAQKQDAVLEALRAMDRPATTLEIARHLGAKQTTVSNQVNALARRGLVVVAYVETPRFGGRPGRHWTVPGWKPPERKDDWRATWTPRPDEAAAWMFVDPRHVGGPFHAA